MSLLWSRDLASVGSLRGSGPVSLNWLFLVESIVVIVLVIFYFFYLSRVLGLVVAAILRLLLWKSNNAYFEIGSIQFSLLGGRITFSDLRYISRNQTLRIVEGRITWRYWKWRVRSENDPAAEARLPCRVTVTLQGAEWFLYNRTPSYDAILEQLGVKDPLGESLSEQATATGSEERKQDFSEAAVSVQELVESVEEFVPPKKVPTDWLREALPIEIQCKTGSIIMGNPSTSNILIAGFEKVSGSYSAVKSRSQFDDYKQVYRFTFDQPKIVFRSNPDYRGPMTKHGEEVIEKLQSNPHFNLEEFSRAPPLFASILAFRHLLHGIPLLHGRGLFRSAPKAPAPPPPAASAWEWQGLPRYQSNSDEKDGALPAHRVEYAKVTTLLASPELELTYYCDTAGKVPKVPRVVTGFAGLETCDIGNGDLSPEWGVDLVIKGGVITYGPWADRQRSEIQQAFTPTTFFNQSATPRLKPGDERMHTALKVFIEFSEGATLRIPTRESSKDWKYDGLEATTYGGSVVRPYGWLDIALGSNSTMSYVLPMVATSEGFDTLVELHLDEMSITSSVNYATFLNAATCRVHCGLPSPLIWDALRTWTVDVTLSKPDISLLRDHITLMSDIAKDWTSGPPGNYEHFVPFMYAFNLTILDYTLRLFVNDHNIINNPSTLEDNSLVICRGPRLVAEVSIPSDHYRMECSTVSFKVIMSTVVLSMSLPDWNTHNAFLTDNTRTFATTPELAIDGNYRFYANANPDNVERLAIAVKCRDVVFNTMGWMVRHMFNLRDNYFGTFTHFVTLEEYRHRHERDLQGDPLELKYRPGATDVFEVVVTLDLQSGLMLLPEELYDCRSAVVLVLPQLLVDLRNHDFFMEMSVNLEPFRVIEASNAAALIKEGFASAFELPDCVRVQGLEVTANRLFGPQPRTATYMCIWSIYLGNIVGSIPPSFLVACGRMANSIGSNFTDTDNSLPADFAVQLDPDATFLTVNLTSVDLAVRGQGTAVQLALPEGVAIRFDDLASEPFLQHIDIDIPILYVRFLAPLFGRAAPWMEVASLEADFSIILGLSKDGWKARSEEQLAFLAKQDSLTKRCPFIYGGGPGASSHVGSLFLPALANPVRDEDGPKSNAPTVISRSSRTRPSQLKFTRSAAFSDEDSDTSEDDYETTYQRLPGRSEPGDRFSAYGSILQLCRRAPEATFLDRPTFRRLPAAARSDKEAAGDAPPPALSLPSMKLRLAKFGPATRLTPHGRTAVDISSRRPIRIVLTPVAVQVGADVLNSIPVEHDLEHLLDDLMDDYVSSHDWVPSVRFSSLDVRASIPSIQLETIQDVLRPESAISIRPGKDNEAQSGATVLCTVRLTLDAIAVSYSQTQDGFGSEHAPEAALPPVTVERKLSASTQSNRLQVFHPARAAVAAARAPHPPLRRSHNLPETPTRQRPTALDLTIAKCEVQLDFSPSRSLVALTGGDATLDFVDEAAELVIGSIWSWRVVQDVAGSLRDRSAERKHLTQHLIWAILRSSEEAAITSFPTFLNRVSYLVGSSTNLRSDDGWKILHHLRHCFRATGTAVEHALSEPREWPDQIDVFSDVVEILGRWRSWEIDSDDLGNSSFLRTLYGASGVDVEVDVTIAGPSAEPSWDKPASLEWRAGRFEAFLSDGPESGNRLAIGPVEAFVESSGRVPDEAQVRVRGRVTLQELDAHVDPDLLLLARHIIGVRRTFERKIQIFQEAMATAHEAPLVAEATASPSDLLSSTPSLLIDLSFGARKLGVKAVAENLEAKAVISESSVSFAVLLEPTLSRNSRPIAHQMNATSSVSVGSLSLALSEVTLEREELLLSTELDQFTLLANAIGSHAWEGSTNEVPSLQIVLGARALRLTIPRDAIRLYEFVETWRSENLPKYDSLLSELRDSLDDIQATALLGRRPDAVASPTLLDMSLAKGHFGVQVAIALILIELQAIPTLKMGYSIQDLAAHARTTGDGPREGGAVGPVDAGLHVGLQSVRFVEVDAGDKQVLPASATDFDLPVVRIKARLDGVPCRHITLLTTVDPVSVKLTVSTIDNLLLVQARFGADIDKLLSHIRSKRARLATVASEPSPARAAAAPSKDVIVRTSIEWESRVALLGLKIGLEGPQATQWVEAASIEGFARSPEVGSRRALHWEASVQRLALSLSQRVPRDAAGGLLPADPRYRLAFFRLDLSISNTPIRLPDLPAESIYGDDETPHLHVRLPRVHAVMQPSAVEALGDLIDHFQEEVLLRRTVRRLEVEAIRERVIQTLDMAEGPADSKAPSWLTTCVVSLEAGRIGIAIPLSDEGIPAPSSQLRRGKSAQSRPAFLVTIDSVKFSTRKGSAGFAAVNALALQFVPDFDQGRKEDFEGPTHEANRNRVRFPEMRCKVRAASVGPILVHSTVVGIEIDLDSSAVAYAFSLIDVFTLSNERFAKFAPLATPAEAAPVPAEQSTSALGCASGVQATFEFKSGRIRMHSKTSGVSRPERVVPAAPPTRGRARPPHIRGFSADASSAPFRAPKFVQDAVYDQFNLPGMSVWAEYHHTDKISESSRLHIDVDIHASNNTLEPTLIPFITDIARQLKKRALQSTPPSPHAPAASSPVPASLATIAAAAVEAPPPAPSGAFERLKFNLSLKIDQSDLIISCKPAPVRATLRWASGGFLLSLSPDVKGFNFVLQVDGVSASLEHNFSPEKCLLAEAKGITASASFDPPDDPTGASMGTMSVVVDLPDIAAEVNFRHLQVWLAFKAVWIDHMDLGVAPDAPAATASSQPLTSIPESTPSATSRLTTIVLVDLKKVRLTCDLGQSIGRFVFLATAIDGRLRWVPGQSRRLGVGIGRIEISGQGRAGGNAFVDGVLFETLLRDEGSGTRLHASDLLHIQIGLGKMGAILEYSFQKILLFSADPIAISVDDDWSKVTTDAVELELAFQVKMGSFNLVATVATIPTLVGVGRRVQTLMAEKATQAELMITESGLPPRPTTVNKTRDAVSAIASQLGSGSEAGGPDCQIRIRNALHIECDRIRIAIFPDHLNDGEVFRLDAGSTIRASLVRGVDSANKIERNLQLYLGFFSIRKVSHRKVSSVQEKDFTVPDWYELFRTSTERNIFKVPTTEVSMESEQIVGSNRLTHKFAMVFGGQVDIALNYALLRNLGSLASTYQELMDREAPSATHPPPTPAEVGLPKALDAPGPIVTTMMPELTVQTIGEDSLPLLDAELVKMKLMPLSGRVLGESRVLEYEAVEMNIHQPKLNLLGEATPPLEWLGLQRARFPAWIHTGVTSPLEELLIFLSSTYQVQLARQKLAERGPMNVQADEGN
ncbi:hypothetical protein RQP46_006502 [Phenoliferia psychrophenolica]